MRINLSPQRRDDSLAVNKAGDVLTINGDELDLSVLPDGATIENGAILHPMLTGPIDRVGGQIELTLILPHGPDPSQPVAFPAPLLNPPDGELVLPQDKEAADEQD